MMAVVKGVQVVFVVLLQTVWLTAGLEFTLTPTPVAPGGTVVFNCTLSTGITKSSAFMFKDQNDQTLVLYQKGHDPVPSQLADYKGRISNIKHPDQTKTWASFEYHVPWCYQLQQFKCHLIDDVTDQQEIQDLKIQHIEAPDLYRGGSCLTCGTDAVKSLELESVNDTALECRLDGVTEASRLEWSKDYFLVPDTNLTFKDSEKCVYNHTSTATASSDHPPGKTVGVYCTAITSQGLLKSPVIQVKIGKDDSKTGSRVGGGKSTTTYIVVGILCAVVVLAIVVGVILYMKRRPKEKHPYQPGQVIQEQRALTA